MQHSEDLDRAFGALADPTRRAMLSKLGHGETCTVSELAEPFDMSLPAAMKHIAVLENAGLLLREKTGRTVHCRFNPAPMREAMDWLEQTQKFWEKRLDALADFVEAEAAAKSATKPNKRAKK
ncbi:MAG: metalloregulator ArsR/SmtB family transcription factor [Pseudomonadota bacterium]